MSIKFEDGTIVSYVRDSYQLNYGGVLYVNKDPEYGLNFAHNAKARLQPDKTIHILNRDKVFCELVPARMIQIPVAHTDQMAIFYEGADFVEYMGTKYYNRKPMIWPYSRIVSGVFDEGGCLEINVRLRRGCDRYLLKKNEQPETLKRKMKEICDDSQEGSSAKRV